MEKTDVLQQLRLAKTAHITWVQKAKLLINGFAIEEDAIPVNCTDCQFGKWFYSDAQLLYGMNNNPLVFMKEIEDLHFKLHDEYLNIFKIFYHTKEKGFFAKMFKLDNKKNPSPLDIKLAKGYYKNMEKISEQLLDKISLMERRITDVSEEEISALV